MPPIRRASRLLIDLLPCPSAPVAAGRARPAPPRCPRGNAKVLDRGAASVVARPARRAPREQGHAVSPCTRLVKDPRNYDARIHIKCGRVTYNSWDKMCLGRQGPGGALNLNDLAILAREAGTKQATMMAFCSTTRRAATSGTTRERTSCVGFEGSAGTVCYATTKASSPISRCTSRVTRIHASLHRPGLEFLRFGAWRHDVCRRQAGDARRTSATPLPSPKKRGSSSCYPRIAATLP